MVEGIFILYLAPGFTGGFHFQQGGSVPKLNPPTNDTARAIDTPPYKNTPANCNFLNLT